MSGSSQKTDHLRKFMSKFNVTGTELMQAVKKKHHDFRKQFEKTPPTIYNGQVSTDRG